MPAHLIIAQGPRAGERFPLDRDEIRIGRTGCDISLADAMVSRVHARILRRGTGYDLEDLGSRNGVLLNDARILRARLADGARIVLGDTVLEFHCGDTPPDPGDGAPGAFPAATTHTITLDASAQKIVSEYADDNDRESLRRAKSDLEAIYRANQALNRLLAPGPLIERTLDIILAEIPQADACSLHLVHETSGNVVHRQQRRRDPADTSETPAFSTSLVRLALRERQSLLTYDAQEDGDLKNQASIAALDIRSAMCVPLQSRDRILGVLQANTVHPNHRFDREDLKLLTAIGLQAGIALENALLYEKLAAEKAALHAAHENLKAAQASLVQSEKLAAIGRLTAGIVHDVKNPMTVILTRAELLEQRLQRQGPERADIPDTLASLKAIQEGVLHCNEIVNRLLQFARQSPPDKTLLDLNELIESTLAFLDHEFRKAKVDLDKRLEPGLPAILADANQIRQVLLNLLINAIQSLPPEGGRIEVATAAEQAGGRSLATCRIRDHGVGMTPEVKQRLFEPFFSTKRQGAGPGGSGLGLSVSYGLVQNHGGVIEVESEPGQGAAFTIKLPAGTETDTQPPDTVS